MRDIAKFISGFERFKNRYFREERGLFERLGQGQHPRALFIACCDSRVDPAILTGADPGDLFVVRNVANLVPPYGHGAGAPGIRAAIEFAVRCLEVEHIIVLGHSQCGGIQALMAPEGPGEGLEFVPAWMEIAATAREQVLRQLPHKSAPLQARACEQAAILVSLDNLLTFPWISDRVESGKVALHGWYFDLGSGELLDYSPADRTFRALTGGAAAGREAAP